MARKRQSPRVFNALRIEAWQQQMQRGDCFLVLARPGVAVWGIAEAKTDTGAWHATLYSEASPDGVHDVVKVTQMDLPVTDKQFAAARRMEWPCEMDAVRAIVSMTSAGAA